MKDVDLKYPLRFRRMPNIQKYAQSPFQRFQNTIQIYFYFISQYFYLYPIVVNYNFN